MKVIAKTDSGVLIEAAPKGDIVRGCEIRDTAEERVAYERCAYMIAATVFGGAILVAGVMAIAIGTLTQVIERAF
jgi:hypothetical protein